MKIEFDDRLMAHLQIVINAKLRRHEGFFFNWRDDPTMGERRTSIWLHNATPLYFHYSTSEHHEINREWLEQLSLSANQAQGLQLSAEPGKDLPPPNEKLTAVPTARG